MSCLLDESHHPTTGANYRADDNTVYTSDPRVKGTSAWKVNGKVRKSSPMGVELSPTRYVCSGDDLRFYGEGWASEWTRVRPPGVPV